MNHANDLDNTHVATFPIFHFHLLHIGDTAAFFLTLKYSEAQENLIYRLLHIYHGMWNGQVCLIRIKGRHAIFHPTVPVPK